MRIKPYEKKEGKRFLGERNTINISFKNYSSSGSGKSQSRSTLTWPRAFSSLILCSTLATSLRVNTAASGLIDTELIPALMRNSVNSGYTLGAYLNSSGKSSLRNSIFSRGIKLNFLNFFCFLSTQNLNL